MLLGAVGVLGAGLGGVAGSGLDRGDRQKGPQRVRFKLQSSIEDTGSTCLLYTSDAADE